MIRFLSSLPLVGFIFHVVEYEFCDAVHKFHDAEDKFHDMEHKKSQGKDTTFGRQKQDFPLV